MFPGFLIKYFCMCIREESYRSLYRTIDLLVAYVSQEYSVRCSKVVTL